MIFDLAYATRVESLQFPRWDTDLDLPKRRAQLLSELDAWIKSPVLSDLAATWNGSPSSTQARDLFDWYDEFSSQRWDRRAGQERNLAAAADLTRAQEAATMTVADSIGLLTSRPPERTRYDFMLILGGLIRACVTRPRYARELLDSGIDVGHVTALGGFRPLAGDEADLARILDVTAGNEFEAMIAGLKAAFPSLGPESVSTSAAGEPGNADWAIAKFSGDAMTVIAAPSRQPEDRRANTADTFAWWAASMDDLRGKHVLLVTNPIYVPYQGAAATENLGIKFDVTVETVGISATAADLGDQTQPFGPSNYLQEIRSAIRGYHSLYATAARLAAGAE